MQACHESSTEKLANDFQQWNNLLCLQSTTPRPLVDIQEQVPAKSNFKYLSQPNTSEAKIRLNVDEGVVANNIASLEPISSHVYNSSNQTKSQQIGALVIFKNTKQSDHGNSQWISEVTSQQIFHPMHQGQVQL